MLTVEVKYRDASVEKVTMPVCRARPDAQSSQGGQAAVDFLLRATGTISWSGYRDGEPTPAGETIEGNLWQAGAERDRLLIGVSFSTHDRILMNAVHVARADRRVESTIASDVTVVTYPAK